MRAVDGLERAEKLDGLVGLGQRCARLLRPGRSPVSDGAVVHGPATAPQPVFQARVAGDVIQVSLPGAG